MDAQHTPAPVNRALLDAAILERIAASAPDALAEPLRAIAERMRQRAAAHEQVMGVLQYVLEDEPSGVPRASSATRAVLRAALAKDTWSAS